MIVPVGKAILAIGFLDIPTSEWDSHNDDFVHINTPISYCPVAAKAAA